MDGESLRFSTVLFDLDGTLTDPGDGIVNSLGAALRELDLPEPSRARLGRCVGPPLRESFLELGARPEQLERLIDVYRARYREVGMFENFVYPDIPGLLGELVSRGCQLRVATSKPTPFAEAILAHFQLRDFFVGVHGSHLDGSLADKRELLAHIRTEAPFASCEAALVGDRSFDIKAARGESLFSVGALWGYGSRSELVAARADVLADRPRDVVDALAG